MKAMTGEQRKQLIDEIMALQSGGELTLGMAVRRLRLEITGFDQATFAQMCGMSTRALYQLETDKGNPTLSTIDSILRKFGLRMGIMAATALPSRAPALTGKRNGVSDVDKYSDPSRNGAFLKSRGSKPKRLMGHKSKHTD
ncbi:MAG: helix-turn-helix transcriptional regulator [Pseudoalteromonas distincta]|tara:strand:- start:37178 stop:37600 length:423 start_codon:yes stop_codon:yes gene_type:complete